MPRGRRPGSHQQIKCGICLHPERGRIDFLVCSGAGVQPTAKKFGVSYDSLRNHVAKHISQSYRDAVRSGPLQSEEQLRRLVAESGAGVIENLKAIYSGLASRWLHAFEAGDDHKLSLLTGKLHVNLEMQARITKELSPGGSVHIQNNYLMNVRRALAQGPHMSRRAQRRLRLSRSGAAKKIPGSSSDRDRATLRCGTVSWPT
jgi:hypothetical protein